MIRDTRKYLKTMILAFCVVLISFLLISCSYGKNEPILNLAPSGSTAQQSIVNTDDSSLGTPIEKSNEKSASYPAEENEGINFWDFDMAYDMCKSALMGFYNASITGSDFDLDLYISNKNLKEYTMQKIKMEYKMRNRANAKMNKLDIKCGLSNVELRDNVLYLRIVARIKDGVGCSAEPTEFLVKNNNGKLLITDWYTYSSGISYYDSDVRKDLLTIEKPDIWDDMDWVKKIFEGLE